MEFDFVHLHGGPLFCPLSVEQSYSPFSSFDPG